MKNTEASEDDSTKPAGIQDVMLTDEDPDDVTRKWVKDIPVRYVEPYFPMYDFPQLIATAMEQFVVRKEVICTSSGQVTTTLTFARPELYSTMHCKAPR